MPYTSSQGPRIYYEFRGDDDKPVLVMIRGLGRSLLHWPEPLLHALLPDFRLLLLDNRGVGRSGPVFESSGLRFALSQSVSRPFSTATMADDVARVMDAAELERAHIFGMSLGGMAAQRLALDHAQRVDGLVLGCTTCGGPGSERAGPDVWATLVRARLQSQRKAIATEASVQLSQRYRDQHPEVLDKWQELARLHPVDRRTMMAHLLAGARHNSQAELGRIEAPTLVMVSDADRLMPAANSVQLARLIPNARLGWLDGAGHDFVTEQPERCAKLMRHFLLVGEDD